MSDMVYAALDVDGSVLGIAGDVQEAIRYARDRGASDARIAVEEVPAGPELKQNPLAPHEHLQLAVENSGLPVMTREEVFRYTLADAYHVLRDFLPERKWQKGAWREVHAYDTPKKAAKTFLGGNFKMNKRPEGVRRGARAVGLSLLPAAYLTGQPDENGLKFVERIRNKLVGRGASAGDVLLSTRVNPLPAGVDPKTWTVCQGSVAACREGCLVVTGQNEADAYNAQRKIAMTNALLQRPQAFVRLLYDACHSLLTKRTDLIAFARLNVFSDIPWEVIAPFLFEDERGNPLYATHAPGGFYDYTKVEGRTPPDNYNLTFSYSGKNMHYVGEVLGMGGHVAIVFQVPGASSAARYAQPLPESLWGYPVVDGDDYDMRTFDSKEPCVIGLRWKPPQVRGTVRREAAARAAKTPFVLPFEEGAIEQHERFKNVSSFYMEDGYLVAPVRGRSTTENYEEPEDPNVEEEAVA